jgi:tryptophan halogenase
MALRWLIEFFPGTDMSPVLADHYNKFTHDLYEDIRDFIVLHYATSNRTDSPFWIEARAAERIPDSLKSRLELWKQKLPGALECNNPYSLFESWNFIDVLVGKGFYNGIELPGEAAVSLEDFTAALRGMEQTRAEILRNAPDHRDVLTRIRGGDYRPWYNPVPASAPSVLEDVAGAAASAIA